MKKLLLSLLSLAMLFSCSLGSEQKDDPNRTEVLDSEGEFLGYLSAATEQGVLLLTKDRYLLYVDWYGDIMVEGSIYYTEENGGGIPYVTSSYYNSFYAKTIIRAGDNYYNYKDDDGNGISDLHTGNLQFKSQFDNEEDRLINVLDTPRSDEKAFELKVINRADIDYPVTVKGPISISF